MFHCYAFQSGPAQDRFIETAVRPQKTAFCSCLKRGAEAMSACVCGEEENDTDANRENTVEWSFSGERATDSAVVRGGGREVLFSPTYSTGNAVCLGGEALNADLQHFWEIKMNHMVYGSSLMVGIATDRFDVDAVQNDFEVPLGRDDSSWGYNYNGDLHHGGVKTKKGERWMQGAILGVHLDRFRGTLEYYLNREPLGIAYTGIPKEAVIYPAVSSSAARSGLKLIFAKSYSTSLSFECIRLISRSAQPNIRRNFLHELSNCPGLRAFVENNYWFLAGPRKAVEGEDVNRRKRRMPDADVELASSSEDEVTFKVATQSRNVSAKGMSNSDDAMSDDREDDYELFFTGGGTEKPNRTRPRPSTSRKTESDSEGSSDFFDNAVTAVSSKMDESGPSTKERTSKRRTSRTASKRKFVLKSKSQSK